ncbi:MAG: PilZ domain-containing protein [Colwellia sp.]
MTEKKVKSKFDQYNEFFSIKYPFSINITPLSNEQVSSYESFSQAMPIAFKMASDIEEINQSSHQKTTSSSDFPAKLTEVLNLQSQKIDLLMDFILSQEDDKTRRFKGLSFGGGGLSFESRTAFELEQFLEIKLFMLHRHCAIFCYAQVIESTIKNKEPEKYEHKVVFHFIRDSDRESLVRFSLKEQSKQLQHLANERSNSNPSS